MRRIFLLFLIQASLAVFAQEDETEWLLCGRPLHETETEERVGERGPRRIGSQATAPMQAVGHKRVPLVLVAFADKKFTAADSTDAGVNAYYQLFCNGTLDGTLYTGHGSHGSVRDYFVQQSDSLLFLEFQVIGPVTLDGACADYGRNEGRVKDVGFNKFRTQALSKAMSLYSDWSSFDNNGDGDIDMVFFVYAGMGENSGGDADCIWPRETTTPTVINGYTFACSAATNESRPGKSDAPEGSTRTDGIGVFVHEFSHALGLPDFYDYDTDQQGDIGFGMDSWSVMDYGAYVSNGYWPAGYNAYERDFMGWRPLVEIDEPAVLTLSCVSEGGVGYKIVNDANPDEYYIIENRQPRGWDQALCKSGHGLQVTHVDYVPQLWSLNRLNTDVPDHLHMTIVAASNDYTGVAGAANSAHYKEMLQGHLYPGATANYNLTDESTPAATMYAGGLLHKPLRNITENADGTVTVCFRTNGQLSAPQPSLTAEAGEDSYLVAWESVEHATQYVAELYCQDTLCRRDTLAESQQLYPDLPLGCSFSVRVQALADIPEDYLASPWSESLSFETRADLIQPLTETESLVEVLSVDGIHKAFCSGKELKALRLPRGIYILRSMDGSAATKVALR